MMDFNSCESNQKQVYIMQEILQKLVAAKHELSEEEAEIAFSLIFDNKVSDAQIASFLTFVACRGRYTAIELTAAAKILRSKMKKVKAPKKTIDVCGTGGDGKSSLNISTAVALTLASMGMSVAKHGNRKVSSKSGSADILEKLGVKIEQTAEEAEYNLQHNNFCFLYAPIYHESLKQVANIRKELGFKTVFNFIGPLINPAQVKYQLIGISNSDVYSYANSLQNLGIERAWVVNSEDGLDEISISARTSIVEISDNKLERFDLEPGDFGLKYRDFSEIKGGDIEYNYTRLKNLLQGKEDAYMDIVAMNVSAALYILKDIDSLLEGVKLAKEALIDGRTAGYLDRLIGS